MPAVNWSMNCFIDMKQLPMFNLLEFFEICSNLKKKIKIAFLMQFNRIYSCFSKQRVQLHTVLQVRYWLYLTTSHNPTSKELMPLSTLQCSQYSEPANSGSTLEWEFQKKKGRKFKVKLDMWSVTLYTHYWTANTFVPTYTAVIQVWDRRGVLLASYVLLWLFNFLFTLIYCSCSTSFIICHLTVRICQLIIHSSC